MTITICPYTPDHAALFARLNRDWIEHYFTIEPIDELMLSQPEKFILEPGGEIWVAVLNGKPVGVAALLASAPGMFEFARLAVDKAAQGHGAARALLRHCTTRAKDRGAHTLKIFANTKLTPACTLYRSEHFLETPMSAEEKARYARGDILFQMDLAD